MQSLTLVSDCRLHESSGSRINSTSYSVGVNNTLLNSLIVGLQTYPDINHMFCVLLHNYVSPSNEGTHIDLV